jgi:cell division protein ZapA
MGQVSVSINGRQVLLDGVRGRAGEPSHPVAQELDQRIAGLCRDFGETGDMRLTVMAALIVADELVEQGGCAASRTSSRR